MHTQTRFTGWGNSDDDLEAGLASPGQSTNGSDEAANLGSPQVLHGRDALVGTETREGEHGARE